jgi:DNA methylase
LGIEPAPATLHGGQGGDPQNANLGTSRGRHALERSLREYGAGRAVLIDRHGTVIAGNKTVQQAKALKIPLQVVKTDGTHLIAVQREDLDLARDPRARALAIADNRIAELDLEWDPDILKQHLAEGVDLNDLWTAPELERLLGEGLHPGITDDDHTVHLRTTDIVRGELFEFGRHRLLCGDATNDADVTRLLAGAAPVLMITDPPYGVTYDPAWRSRACPGQRTAVGAVLNDDRVDWTEAFRHFPGDVAYVWHAGLHAGAVAASLLACDFPVRSQIVWAKQHFVMSRGDYHWQHEPCWYAVRRGQSSHWQGDRTQSTVWSVPNLNPLGGERNGENAVTGHGTQKPVRLFERAILNHTITTDGVYDPFVGSGTAIIAAEKTGRAGFAMELDPVYVQATVDRWEAYTGTRAVRIRGARGARQT